MGTLCRSLFLAHVIATCFDAGAGTAILDLVEAGAEILRRVHAGDDGLREAVLNDGVTATAKSELDRKQPEGCCIS